MRLTRQRLREFTLARQFPGAPLPGPRADRRSAVIDLVERIGPIQSQVPRSPFLAAAARLPGIDYADVRDAFADHDLLKTTNLRGTVHTSTRAQFPWLDAVSRSERAKLVRRLVKPDPIEPEQLFAALERQAADWRDRDAVVQDARDWVGRHVSAAASARLTSPYAENVLWGHGGLIRRPRDDRWERRTDRLHRDVRALLAEIGADPLPQPDFVQAVQALVRTHLAAFGPARVADIAWWMGVPGRPVQQALAALGDHVRRVEGPDGETLLDLTELADGPDRATDPGVRLLGDYEGLLLGYQAQGRARFVDQAAAGQIASGTTVLGSPMVLHEGRLVATWRTVPSAGGVRIEVEPFQSRVGLSPALLDGPAADVARVLELSVTDIGVLPPPADRASRPARG